MTFALDVVPMPPADPAPLADDSVVGVPARRHDVVLVPHPASPRLAVRAISAAVTLDADGGLKLEYALSGRLEGLRIPASGPVTRGDRLWEHTCFEVFLRAGEAPAYIEFNFSPARQWAAYTFTDYREPDVPWSGPAPSIEVKRGDDRLEVSVRMAPAIVSPWVRAPRLRVALSAVVESSDGERGYWALRHPAGRPDFHHADAFALVMDMPATGATS